jgi:cyclase
MLKKRLIACLIVYNGLIVQSIGFKKYLPVGRPRFSIEFVARWDVDEIVLLDISATRDGSINVKTLEMLSKVCFVPLTVGGGIRSVNDALKIIKGGADKICINTHALERSDLIKEIASKFGSQCVVVSIDCRLDSEGRYRVYSNSGTKNSGLDPVSWAKEVERLGAGEIFLHSIDRDGLKQGYDTKLIKMVTDAVSIPVIASGGVGFFSDFSSGIIDGGADAVAAANIFHHTEHSTIVAKTHLLNSNIEVRIDSEATYKNRDFDDSGRLIKMSESNLSKINIKRGKKELI